MNGENFTNITLDLLRYNNMWLWSSVFKAEYMIWMSTFVDFVANILLVLFWNFYLFFTNLTGLRTPHSPCCFSLVLKVQKKGGQFMSCSLLYYFSQEKRDSGNLDPSSNPAGWQTVILKALKIGNNQIFLSQSSKRYVLGLNIKCRFEKIAIFSSSSN